ncbi:MAG: HAD family hydrolase [Anaerolineales bacterium]|jgi:putative hydrolase of the HAD superfamily
MRFDLIALDADDTLWHNEIYYRRGRETFRRIMAKYGQLDPDEMRLHELEIANLEFYGYGAVGFAVSMAEAAAELTDGRIVSEDLIKLLAVSKTIIAAEVELLEGADKAVRSLSDSHKLMLITKGNELHQASKINRSGLHTYFEHIEIVAEKTPGTYADILDRIGIAADHFIMVGNALKSDILPVLEIGASAVYIHNDLTWSHEHADPSGLPDHRYYELETIEALPGLIASLED